MSVLVFQKCGYFGIEVLLVNLLHAVCTDVCNSAQELVETCKSRREGDRFQPSKISRGPNVWRGESYIKPRYEQCEWSKRWDYH